MAIRGASAQPMTAAKDRISAIGTGNPIVRKTGAAGCTRPPFDSARERTGCANPIPQALIVPTVRRRPEQLRIEPLKPPMKRSDSFLERIATLAFALKRTRLASISAIPRWRALAASAMHEDRDDGLTSRRRGCGAPAGAERGDHPGSQRPLPICRWVWRRPPRPEEVPLGRAGHEDMCPYRRSDLHARRACAL